MLYYTIFIVLVVALMSKKLSVTVLSGYSGARKKPLMIPILTNRE